ncbi:MAG: 23S rRNA (adenine(2503)-C(2))-methyltransferase RlmN [Pseudomonadota bacterium]
MTDPAPQSDILDLGAPGLSAWLKARGIAPYRTAQILRWICLRQMDRFEDMTDLGKDLREELAQNFTIPRLDVLERAESSDGSEKFLFGLADGQSVEAVLMPERDHHTLCVSSQIGCAMGCAFCRTGAEGLSRNLTAGEMVAQVRDVLAMLQGPDRLTNLVFMGMGEPLANYENLRTALSLILDAHQGLSFAGRRVTVSTAGLASKIVGLGQDTRVNLAISLNAVDDETRSAIMPVNRIHPIRDLLAACDAFPLRPGRRITFEYVLLAGVNDSLAEARELARMLSPRRAKINLIPFNPHDRAPYDRPDEAAVLAFQQVLLKANFTAVIRQSKGADIAAACGQLRAARQGVSE